MNLSKPIFILGAHKSGTTLLRNILDGHPDLFVIPVETHFFQLMEYWVDNEYRKQQPGTLTRESAIEKLCNWIHTYNTSEAKYSDSQAKGLFNEALFREKMETLPENPTEIDIFGCYFQAIYEAIHQKNLPVNIRIVEKSVENAEFALELHHLFPDARFVHILRNPYSNLVSLRKYQGKKFGYPIIRRMVKTLYNSYYFLYKNRQLLPEYTVVRYEDLVQTPEQTLQTLIEFLDIPWNDRLLIPSVLGQPWGGNSITDQQFTGISAERLEQWQEDIHPMERYYVNRMFSFVLDDYGYDRLRNTRGFWMPVKGENFQRYFANRIYRYLQVE